MANPQLENGHLRIANEVWDALAQINIPGRARQVLDVIIRKTYGFNKKRDAIAYSQFTTATGMDRRHIPRAIKTLLEMQLIRRFSDIKDGVRGVTSYSFEKDYDKWRVTPKMVSVTPNTGKGDINSGKKVTPNMMSTKDITTKDSIQKTFTRKKRVSLSPDHKPFIEFFVTAYLEKFKQKYHFVGGRDGKTVQALLKDFDIGTLKAATHRFFDDDWIRENGALTLTVFRGQINKFINPLPTKRKKNIGHTAGKEDYGKVGRRKV